jgi:hypothetical protein
VKENEFPEVVCVNIYSLYDVVDDDNNYNDVSVNLKHFRFSFMPIIWAI